MLPEPQPLLRFLVVHPILHTSGFGNQVGMLLQHLAVARLSGRSLALPPIHQPTEHRAPDELDEESRIDADGVFNLTTLSTASSTVLTTREATSMLAAAGVALKTRQLTFASATGDGDGAPLRMRPAPLPAVLAAVELLRDPAACAAGASRRGAGARVASTPCMAIGYCHLVSCRSRTKRACRRQRCTRSAQRLPNNYLFAHRLPPLLCGVLDQQPGGGGDSLPADAPTRAALLGVWRLQHMALRQMRLAAPLRDGAAQAAAALGCFVAIHVRLTDRAPSGGKASGSPTKGLNHTGLPAMVRRVAPLLLSAAKGPESGSTRGGAGAGSATVLYIATNRPDVVRAMRAELAAAALEAMQAGAAAPGEGGGGSEGGGSGGGGEGGGSGGGGGSGALLLRGWYDLPAAQTEGLRGLRAALLEHELCATWARAYAGSVWSTWSNLIGARRWARGGVAAAAAYLDVQSGLPAPTCAAQHTRAGWPDADHGPDGTT